MLSLQNAGLLVRYARVKCMFDAKFLALLDSVGKTKKIFSSLIFENLLLAAPTLLSSLVAKVIIA